MSQILVVDDEIGIRELLSEILREEGHQVRLAENASEARLRQIRSDSATHAAQDAATLAQLREHEQSIAELRTTVEQQRAEITMLEQKVDSVVRANIVLVTTVWHIIDLVWLIMFPVVYLV